MRQSVNFLIIVLVLFPLFSINAQKFVDGAFTFSSKKISIVNLKNGKTVKGYIKDIDRKKGLIEEIEIKDSITEKKQVYKAEDISNMYLPPSGFDKFATANKKFNDTRNWGENNNIQATYIKEGYVLFELKNVNIKGDIKPLLVQLLNPGFSSKIQVYLDPYASETTSFSLGGFNVAGGDSKSYYVSKNGATTFLLKKKNYDEEFKQLYGDCPSFYKKGAAKIKWDQLEEDIFKYTETCTKN